MGRNISKFSFKGTKETVSCFKSFRVFSDTEGDNKEKLSLVRKGGGDEISAWLLKKSS